MDDSFKENCDEKNLWVGYKDMPKLVQVGKHVYIDNGLICLKVKEVGKSLAFTHETWFHCEMKP